MGPWPPARRSASFGLRGLFGRWLTADGCVMGVEPTNTRTTTECLRPLGYTHHEILLLPVLLLVLLVPALVDVHRYHDEDYCCDNL